MTLPPLVLDDLTWETLTEAARRRIPAASGGVWTLHAPVDPGITVVELLAYQLEQLSYRLDQVPDDLVRGILGLLGVDPPAPARPAATVLRFFSDPAGFFLPSGTVFSRDPMRQITFTLTGDVTVLPLADGPPELTAGGRDRSADLRAGRGVPVLGADRRPAEFRLVFTRAETAGRPSAGTALTLLLDLDGPAASPPSWHPDAVADVPPPGLVQWSWFDPATPATEWPVAEVVDGTAGLRRSGVVALPLPAAWCGDGTSPGRYGLRVRTASATWAQPPVLRQAVPNAGAAVHAEARTSAATDPSWRRLPGQVLTLPDAQARLLTVPRAVLRRDGQDQEWTPVATFAFSGPADRVFLIDRAAGALRFGDGLNGAIPAPEALRVDYTLGGGAIGNAGTTTNWLPLDQSAGGVLVTAENVVAADGGRDPETVEQARTRAADDLAEVHRAVTADDFAVLARATPGVAVARAHVTIGAHPGYPCSDVPGAVRVRVLPSAVAVAGAVLPDPGLLTAVAARLAGARLLGTEIYVDGPRYRDVRLRADVRGRPADASGVRAALTVALSEYLDPLAGGDDRTGWPFGGPLRPTALLRVAQAAVGDDAELITVAVGLDGAGPAEGCADTELRAGELPAFAGLTLRVLPLDPARTGGAW
jgi:hypothetical protein